MNKIVSATLLSVAFTLRAFGGAYFSQTFDTGLQNGGAIPDGSLNGWCDTRTVTGGGVHHVADLSVVLTVSNGYTGDLYAYLVHNGAMAILLNRVGLASTNVFGYADPGLNLTLSAAGDHDVHFCQMFSPTYDANGWLNGTWRPDGRGIEPLSDASAFEATGSANFDAFIGQLPDGDWTLFVADVSAGGGQSTVVSWGLQINSATEPAMNLAITSVNGGSFPAAGTPFSVVVQAQDVNGVAANVVADTELTLSLNTSGGTLGGVLNGTITAGTCAVTLSGVTYTKAEGGVVLTATRTSGDNLNEGNSSPFAVNPGPFARLQVLMPGETAAPGSASGKTAALTPQEVNIACAVTVNAVDANWNLISTNDTVHITSSDPGAAMPPDAPLFGGTGTFSITFLTSGSQTVTASDITYPAILPNTGSVTTVNAGDQTITFASPGDQTYGAAPIMLTATASSGLPLSYTVSSGPAQVLGNYLTITGAGSVTIQAAQTGNANWNAAAPVNKTVAVAPKVVAGSITANNKIYDGTSAAAIASRALTGIINSDLANLTGGVATFSDPSVGSGKTVTATGLALSGANADNYVLASAVAVTTAAITPGVVAKLAFTTQPGLANAGAAFGQQPVVQTQDQYGNNSTVGLPASLSLTLTLSSGIGPLQGTTTLDIGSAAGNGSVHCAHLRIDPAGTKQLSASASGLTSASSTTFEIANVAPVAQTATFTRPRNVPLKLLISNLLTNATDANGDTLTLAAVSSTSINGAALYLNATYVLYSTPPGSNVTDSFTYTVSDGTATASGTVLITMQPDPTGTNSNVVAYGLVNGKPTFTFAGVPGYTYEVQRTWDLSGIPVWTDLLSTNAPSAGLFQFVDQNPPVGYFFYRAINQ